MKKDGYQVRRLQREKKIIQDDDSPPVTDAEPVTVSSVSTFEERQKFKRAEEAHQPGEEPLFWGSRNL